MATIEALDADITALEVDAIANAANTELRHGGGVAAAIARAGGPAIDE
jgi:O-acetyl-ADP-ribose deacetylase (regulator of RNase III)